MSPWEWLCGGKPHGGQLGVFARDAMGLRARFYQFTLSLVPPPGPPPDPPKPTPSVTDRPRSDLVEPADRTHFLTSL